MTKLSLPRRRITKGSKQSWEPIKTKIISMKGGGKDLGEMHAGGLCGIATPLDPIMTKADNLTGQVMARKGNYLQFGIPQPRPHSA